MTGAANPHFLSFPDLAARSAGGSVLWANDDLFAERENLSVAAVEKRVARALVFLTQWTGEI